MCLDTNGATWMGKQYIREQQGDEYYFNLNGDTILIKTMAGLNETWTLYKNAGDTLFQAQIIAIDTTLVDGVLDSIKRISIQAYYNGLPIADIHNNQIILSKEHGFLRSLEWCYFGLYTYYSPYYKKEQGHNRLPAEISNRNLNIDASKYNIGNEWIFEKRHDNYDMSGTEFHMNLFKHTTHDSVMNKIQVMNGYNVEIFRRERFTQAINTFPIVVTDDTLTYTTNLFIDTTISSQQFTLKEILPEYNLFVMPDLIRFKDETNLFDLVEYSVSYGCDGKLILSGTSSSEPGSVVYFNDSCFQIQFPLGNDIPIPLERIYIEGQGKVYSKEANVAYIQWFSLYTYYNINGCSSGAKYNIILPADAFELQAILQNQNQVKLFWQTVNEHNVSHFEIERSTDGSHFFTILQKASQGENVNTNSYIIYDDITSIKSTIYYRVKMVDIDGKSSISNTVNVKINSKEVPKVFPTIFSTKITVEGLRKDNAYTIQLVDIYGKIVYHSIQESNSTGQISLAQFDNLAIGNYILTCHDEVGNVVREKVLKVE
jgi:hypothetical protein